MGNLSAYGNVVVQTTPVGVIEAFAGVNAPAGWLFCDGSAISRIQYPELFSALSTTYGSGDGSTTFNLPDMRGRMPVGKGTHADVASLGQNEGASLANRRPKHQHTVYDPQHSHQNYVGFGAGSSSYPNWDGTSNKAVYGLATNNGPNSTGIKINPEGASSSTSPTDAPPYLVVNYIIKAVADLPRGGWFYQGLPPVVTQLPSNPNVGQEVYYYTSNGAYIHQRYDGSAWTWLSNSKPPMCTVARTTSQTSFTNSTAVTWTGATFDTNGMFNASNPTRLTIQTTGIYQITAWLAVAATATLSGIYTQINKNGSINMCDPYLPAYISTNARAGISITASLTTGDYLELVPSFSGGSNYSISGNAAESAGQTRLSATWIGAI